MWGQGYSFLQRSKAQRIIPTRVGTSSKILFHEAFKTDHPHACGDKNIFDIKYYADRGSSPRVWGQVCQACDIVCRHGIIPTRVGTRDRTQNISVILEDHPHACGDKWKRVQDSNYQIGSSPRVWGQVCNNADTRYKQGIIPTRVGTRK